MKNGTFWAAINSMKVVIETFTYSWFSSKKFVHPVPRSSKEPWKSPIVLLDELYIMTQTFRNKLELIVILVSCGLRPSSGSSYKLFWVARSQTVQDKDLRVMGGHSLASAVVVVRLLVKCQFDPIPFDDGYIITRRHVIIIYGSPLTVPQYAFVERRILNVISTTPYQRHLHNLQESV